MNTITNLNSDLAPGDSQSSLYDWSQFEVSTVPNAQNPLFDLAYLKLFEEFASKGELEEKSILEQRLAWNPIHFISDYSFKYEIIVVTQGGQFVATRDHSIIIHRGPKPHAVVHLSHSLIDPAHRGSGLAGWLRSWPIQTARNCLVACGLPENTPLTLVAEMEPHRANNPLDTGARFKSYRRGGFQMLDPTQVPYFQPDFRSSQVIDTQGGPKPLPLRLLVRRIGKESETKIPASEVRETVSALYRMFGLSFRPKDMLPLWEQLRNFYPSDEKQIPLIEPGMDPQRTYLT